MDPTSPRPGADELVLVMVGYNPNNGGLNELCAFNGNPDHYLHDPIWIRQNALLRIYLLNMTELESLLTFHLHANAFQVIRPGRIETTDLVTIGNGRETDPGSPGGCALWGLRNGFEEAPDFAPLARPLLISGPSPS